MTLKIVILGLTITSSWGNGHATTYRGLAKALAQRGHSVAFLEQDAPWYRDNRDMPESPYAAIHLYDAAADAPAKFGALVRDADLVILGSYVPNGAALGEWVTAQARGVTAFYDIDTPVTLAGLKKGGLDYLSARLIPRFDLYLSFTGGPTLGVIEKAYASRRARALYCSVDPELHGPIETPLLWELGYLGTYSADRQPTVQRLLLETARGKPESTFVIGGPQYPDAHAWPVNVEHLEHVPPQDHAGFYCSQRYTLNVTRADMIAAGYSPSVRLFEAAACGVPIISDAWAGLDTILQPGEEILIAKNTRDVLSILANTPEDKRRAIAAAARRRVLASHTAAHRAQELERYYREARAASSRLSVREAVA